MGYHDFRGRFDVGKFDRSSFDDYGISNLRIPLSLIATIVKESRNVSVSIPSRSVSAGTMYS